MGKLNKRSFRPLIDRRQRPVTYLWFSVVNLSLKHAHGIFQTLSLELKAKTAKQTVNTPKTETANVGARMSRTVFTNVYTQSCTFRSFSLLCFFVAAAPIVFNCSTLSFIMASRARQANMVVKTTPASPFIRDLLVERVER